MIVRHGIAAALALAAIAADRAAAQAEERVAPVAVTGVVFHDRNGNGTRDPGEPGIAGARVSDQITVVTTDREGRFSLEAGGYGVVFVSHPSGFSGRGPVWRRVVAGQPLEFPLVARSASTSFTFIHASDTHIHPGNVERTRRLRALVDSLKPAFVLISGDLIRDALRVGEPPARAENELFDREIAQFPVPVYPVPGNHDIFAIERHRSLVGADHPLYGKRMYRSFRGPNYYSFDWGGIHFIGFDTVDFWDLSYFGRVDSAQVGWLARDLAATPATMPVVTFNHIPFVSGAQSIDGYDDESVAPTVIRHEGQSWFRHTVRNTDTVMALVGDRLAIALGGHFHRRELLRYETAKGLRRFGQTAAVTTPSRGQGQLGIRSGITVYTVTNGKVDDGYFIPLEGR